MNGCKLLCNSQIHTLYDFVHHCHSVQCGIALYDFRIVDIVLEKLTADVGEMLRNGCTLCIFQLFQFTADFRVTSLRFQVGNKLIYSILACGVKLSVALILIILRNLNTEVT